MSTTAAQQSLIEQILHAVEQDDFALPTLPNVALKIRELLDDPNVSADQIVSVLSSDPVISSQIIRSANSAAYSGMPQIINVREASLRLGYRQLHNLVISITMNKMFSSNNPALNQRMKQVWEHSRKVAAMCYVLASRQPDLSPDQAMLAGLMHNIGMLPLYVYIEHNRVEIDNESLAILINKHHRTIGTKLLKNWKFSQEIVDAVAEHENFQRVSSKGVAPDYVDLVMFANLQGSSRAIAVSWDNITAVKRLGMDKEECRTFMAQHAQRIENVEILLGMKPRAKPAYPAAATPQNAPKHTQPAAQAAHTAPRKNGGLRSFLSGLWK